MKPATFKKYLKRDSYCPHCGSTDLVPHHRANRGMGGSKLRDNPANILLVCALLNGLMESDPDIAEVARSNGWKLRNWQVPETTPYYDSMRHEWFTLTNDFGKRKDINANTEGQS